VRTIHSPFGQVLKAIKENEPRAISLGYDVRYKLLAFVLSARWRAGGRHQDAGAGL
jgi:branched-chain amino acid transport system permease protein